MWQGCGGLWERLAGGGGAMKEEEFTGHLLIARLAGSNQMASDGLRCAVGTAQEGFGLKGGATRSRGGTHQRGWGRAGWWGESRELGRRGVGPKLPRIPDCVSYGLEGRDGGLECRFPSRSPHVLQKTDSENQSGKKWCWAAAGAQWRPAEH